MTETQDLNYVTWQLTSFSISALHAMGAEVKYPLRFLEKWKSKDTIMNWLEYQRWHDPWYVGNVVMFLGIMLITDYGLSRDSDSKKAVDYILDWHDKFQNPETGFWGEGKRTLYFEGLYGAYHQYLLYFYTGRKLPFMDNIIDRVLFLQQRDGLFSPLLGGGGCEDLDAIDTLVKIHNISTYRKEDIEMSLRKVYNGLLLMQNDDGGFVWARRKRFGVTEWLRNFLSILEHRNFYYWYYCNRKATRGQLTFHKPRYSPGWTKNGVPPDESDIFSTWFRCTSIGLICQVLDDVSLKNVEWRFLKTVGLGWH